ncbi:MAG: hypothetical protein MJE68_01710 [Proteobacteria bacterium]|nr:hypothetical protein [Pseudomonadota bacterium]
MACPHPKSQNQNLNSPQYIKHGTHTSFRLHGEMGFGESASRPRHKLVQCRQYIADKAIKLAKWGFPDGKT